EARLERPLAACSAIGNGADRAGHRRGAHGAGSARSGTARSTTAGKIGRGSPGWGSRALIEDDRYVWNRWVYRAEGGHADADRGAEAPRVSRLRLGRGGDAERQGTGNTQGRRKDRQAGKRRSEITDVRIDRH